MEPSQPRRQFKNTDKEKSSVYSRCLIAKNVAIPIQDVAKNIDKIIKTNIVYNFEGKCVVEGFVKPNSVIILTYSSGIVKGINVIFEVVFECQVCCPVEGMLVDCIAKNITKAGIRGESASETPSPIVVFVARDHQYSNAYFSAIQENDVFTARVIGQRFELNDKYVSIIAEAIEPRKKRENVATVNPKIQF